MFWPFLELQGRLVYCPLADFGASGRSTTRDSPHAVKECVRAQWEDRGASARICDFVTKVLHAQQAGAVAVLAERPSSWMQVNGRPGSRDGEYPAMMVSRSQSTDIFQQIREAYLDRKELCFTIRFLGAQTASRYRTQTQREQQQQEAASLLRNRLGKASQSKGSTAVSSSESVVATPSSSASELALDWSPTSSYSAGSTRRSHSGERSYGMSPGNNQEEVQVEEGVHAAATLAMLHWCPLTTALVIVDFYDRVDNVLIPTIQDVLLACRASEGMEVVYSVVESATRDGRERSRAHKHAGIHVSKNGFGAQVPKRIAPVDESDIVLSRTGVK
ncbi:PA domain [Phytophthora cactorum]|nr:PA domain [Phytophthora cactorum]